MPGDIIFPFKFSDSTWNKIKFRFKDLDIREIFFTYHDGLVINIQHKGKKYLIQQVKLLYYALKYYKNEIITTNLIVNSI